MLSSTGLYYETRGEGEPVLVIQGAVAEAGATSQLADALVAADHQVITYDHRGLSRSAGAAAVDVSIESHAEDAAELLRTVTDRPARVIGTSIGAVIGLQLVVRHLDLVHALVAHEPPLESVVPDPEQRSGLDEVAVLARDDVFAAVRHFASLGGPSDDAKESEASPPPPVGDPAANLRQFFTHDFEAVRSHAPDLERLAHSRVPLTITGGERSRGRWEYRCAQKLAELLDQDLVELPGGHTSLVSHPAGTASALLSLPAFKQI